MQLAPATVAIHHSTQPTAKMAKRKRNMFDEKDRRRQARKNLGFKPSGRLSPADEQRLQEEMERLLQKVRIANTCSLTCTGDH